MSLEELKFAQEAKKNKEKSEAELKLEIEKQTAYRLEHEKLIARIEKDKKLVFLRSLVERGLIRPEIAEKVANNETLSAEELEPIFEKIDAIEQEERIDEILPISHRISREEYLESLGNEQAKEALTQKLDNAIRELTLKSRGGSYHPGVSIFRAFLQLLDKNLQATIIRVKQNMIELRKSLDKNLIQA